MNKKMVFFLVFFFLFIAGLGIILSSTVSYVMGDPQKHSQCLLTCGICQMLLSIFAMLRLHPVNEAERKCGFREAFAVVTLGWVAVSLTGAIPYYFAAHFSICDAVFENTSGFSATGASIVCKNMVLTNGEILKNGIESLSYGILFWRSLSHWLGGMGIVVLVTTFLPLFHISGQGMFNAEVPGVKSPDAKITPRITSSAKYLWFTYIGLTALETILLKAGGMSFFDAVCHSFSTIATGGFSTKNASIGAFDSVFIENVICVFMFLSGCNFFLHIRAFKEKSLLTFWRDEEWRFYTLLTGGAITIIALYLWILPVDYHHFSVALRAATFQVVAILTTTGFTTENFASWPAPCGMILFILMFIGGCSGSTSGGMKCIRVLLMGKFSRKEVLRCFFPHMVPDIKLNKKRIERTVIQKAVGFFALFLWLFLLIGLLTALLCTNFGFLHDKMDLLTALSASLSCLSNIGPGFGFIGPENSFAWMTAPTKLLLSFAMILGRLELFTVLVLFLPRFWKK